MNKGYIYDDDDDDDIVLSIDSLHQVRFTDFFIEK